MYWIRQKIHPTWHFSVLCLGVLVGVTGAQWWSGLHEWLWCVVAIGLFGVSVYFKRRYLLVCAVIGGMVFGLWRGSIDQTSLAMYDGMYGKHVVLKGVVDDDVETNKRDQQVIRLARISDNSHDVTGTIWVTTSEKVNIRRGDHVTVDGKLGAGFGNFVGAVYDAKLVSIQREQPGDVALALRDDFSDKVRDSVHEPAASLGVGYLLGQKRALPEDLQEALKIAGLTHIVVASGYNLTILVRLARRLLERVSKYLAATAGIALIGTFIAMTGISPSMSRAGLVSALALWAWYYGRKFHPVTMLLFAGAITVCINPSYAWGNIGWELSFAAFAGVMVLAPLLQAYFFGEKKPGTIRQILGETASAQIVTAPIILAAFGQFSNIAIVSNLLILPFVPLTMLLTLIAGIGAYVAPAYAQIIAWPAQTILDVMIWFIKWCSNIEWAQGTWNIEWWVVVGWYGCIVFACWYMWRKTHYSLYTSSIVE